MKEELNLQKKLLEKGSFKFLLTVVLLVSLFLMLFTFNQNGDHYQDVNEVISVPVGSTVFQKEDVIDENKIYKFPIILKFPNLIKNIEEENYFNSYLSILTGAVVTPTSSLVLGNVSVEGEINNLTGPGVLKIAKNKIIIEDPDNFVYGYKVSYGYASKTENGIKITENGTFIKELSFNDINENNLETNGQNVSKIKKWAEDPDTKVGSNLTVSYALANFSDGRNSVKPHEIEKFFGKEVNDYILAYPVNSPVMVYSHDYEEVLISSSSSSLGSYPQYGDAIRANNAYSFALAWNGTIIPNGTRSSGKENQGFEIARDPKAPAGGAAHGVCPPARSLRGAITSVGIPLPEGMSWNHEAIQFGYAAASGIKVTNVLDNPIKIKMWTTGSGTGLVIYTELYELVPKNNS